MKLNQNVVIFNGERQMSIQQQHVQLFQETQRLSMLTLFL